MQGCCVAGEVTFTLTEADYVAANRDWLRGVMVKRSSLIRYALILSGCFLIGVASADFFWNRPDWGDRLIAGAALAAYIAVLLGGIVLSSYLLMPRRAGRLFRQQVAMHKPLGVAWSEDGLVYRSANGAGTYAWGDFHRWRDGRSAILIYHTDQMYYIVPHHAVNDEQRADIVDLLTQFGPPLR
jgi:hypothetical protein